jgi:hypothetical protein
MPVVDLLPAIFFLNKFFAMDILLYKGDPFLIANLLALSMEPVPYEVQDRGDAILLKVRDADVAVKRIYDFGRLVGELAPHIISMRHKFINHYPGFVPGERLEDHEG